MEKLTIVTRRRKAQQQGQDSPVNTIESVPKEQEIQEVSNVPNLMLPPSFHIHDGDNLIFKEVTGDEEQIFSIELTPQQSQVVQSMNLIKDLVGGKHQGVKISMEEAEGGKTAFNFHFKPVYTTRMLNSKDVATMLQISRSFLYKLVRLKEIKSYKIGKLRRFLLEDVIDYLSGNIQL
ncbi:MAG: helix-turn-helix domain-containing protein [Syntrophorhabdaceae bacterium]|jgi:excisionase family DNA binding protein|nr:helix-turn-helix domain-containing protein [Syntrophorhabdaceae bacterium]MDD5245441.1 helix-turn-helix domain-containing protein [Syntrophorhabdaceae bacterium]